MSVEILKKLAMEFGPSGFEDGVSRIIKEELSDLDSENDKFGNMFISCGKEKKEGPNILLAAHMDECGFLVRAISSAGFLFMHPLGNWQEASLAGQPILIKNSRNKLIWGVFGAHPVHYKTGKLDTAPAIKDLFVDIGAKDEEEARELFGITLGDPAVPSVEFVKLKNEKVLACKAWDDRAGCAAAISVMNAIKKENLYKKVTALFSVQEEVGCRGANVAMNYVDADLAVIIEAPPTDDTHGTSGGHKPQGAFGKGPQIRLYDPTMILNQGLKKKILDIASKSGVPYQIAIREGGGTDAKYLSLAQKGIPSVVIGIPIRYTHSPIGLLHLDDYKNTIELITQIVRHF